MDIDLALLADAATIDGAGKLNILGIFDSIGGRQFPLKHGRLALVLRFTAGLEDAGSHDVLLRLTDPEGKEMVSLNGTIQLGPGPASGGGRIRVPHILNLDGLVFTQPGTHVFDLSLDGEHSVTIPLRVQGAPAPMDGPVAQA